MNKEILKNKYILLLINTVIFILFAYVLPIKYEDNDDVIMCMIANGVYSGQPDGHLVFINALYGWVLAGLYTLTKAVEWYTLFFCIFHIISMTIIVHIIRRGTSRTIHKVLYTIFLYVIWAFIIQSFQFTTTAALLCFAGCLALLRPERKWKTAGAILIFMASLIRFEVIGLIGILFAPLYISKFLKQKKLIVWVTMITSLTLLCKFTNNIFYQDDDWKYYKEYNDARGKINDNPRTCFIDKIEGVDNKDIDMFLEFECDPHMMNLSVLEKMLDKIDKETTFLRRLPFAIHLMYYGNLILLLSFGAAISLFTNVIGLRENVSSKKNIVVLIASMLLFFFIIVHISTTGILKNRISICLLLPISYLIILLYQNRHDKLGRIIAICFSSVILLLADKHVSQGLKAWKNIDSSRNFFELYQRPLIKTYTGYIYPRAIFLEYLSPFEIKEATFHIAGLGWCSNIPFNKGRLESFQDFVDSDIVYIGWTASPPQHMVERIKQNYGIDAEIIKESFNDVCTMYKFVSKVK